MDYGLILVTESGLLKGLIFTKSHWTNFVLWDLGFGTKFVPYEKKQLSKSMSFMLYADSMPEADN
jgi:hypothetical protein